MSKFFRFFTREITGYFSFPLAYLLLLVFIALSILHLSPGNSPFHEHFGDVRHSILQKWAMPEGETFASLQSPGQALMQIIISFSLRLVMVLPGIALFLLMLARCYRDDSVPREPGGDTGAVIGKLLGTVVVGLLVWLPAIAVASSFGWLKGYDVNFLMLEIGIIAVVAGIFRALLTRGFRTLFTREIKATFYSPIAYVVICFMLAVTGFNFFSGVSFLNRGPTEVTVVEASFNTVLFWIGTLLIFPLITMRTYSDEFRMGTFETMTTAPVRDWEVVFAKFAGALFFYCVLWLPSVSYFVIFQIVTGKQAAMAAGAYGGSYLLLFMLGMFYISIGCLASSLTSEQINAAVMSFVIIFGMFATGLIGMIMNISDPAVRDLISYFSAVEHMADFSRGLLDSRPFVFYLTMTAMVLYVNFHVFQFRKWKA